MPAKIDWIASKFLKARVATGFCSRHVAAGACSYATICETCDNFVPGPEFGPALRDQLADVTELRTDAERRGWTDEAARHGRIIDALGGHLRRLEEPPSAEGFS